MRGVSKVAMALLVASGLSLGVAGAIYAADDHSSHSDGHSSGGKGKGPKYMGGDHGSGHSSQAHKGGSHHHDGETGGSKSVEGKIFDDGGKGKGKGPKYMGGKTAAGGTDHHDGGTEHTH